MNKKKIVKKQGTAAPEQKGFTKNDHNTAIEPVPALESFPIVGIGASAGGLAAFESFFSGMPADKDPGMAFVLVQHLAPDHKSILTELIRRYTRMQVFEVEDGMTVKPNCAYIIPPNRDMAFLNGKLQLLERPQTHGLHLPIDFFFRSLAQDQHERAICIVLSGTGSDGSQGLRAVKAEGGMVIVQKPDTTENDGMPQSAISTGLVDFTLPPAEMPAQLINYADKAFGKTTRISPPPGTNSDNALKKIFILLRSQTGHDFSQYKSNTINRRIERRLALHQIETMEGYIKFLQKEPSEIEALFRDLLIGVTYFFRDQEAFQALEAQVIPALFNGKPESSLIRVWSAGCSTGEEAYSIAILLQERLEILKQGYKVQVFATDIDSNAIAIARAGIYPASIVENVTPERLSRFFTASADGSSFRVNKNIRDILVFSEQDVIKDPPFSKLDMISCRNLLIYLGGELQKKLIPLFHYALNPGGMLFLGTSETVGDFSELFHALDRKSKLYQRKDDYHSSKRAAMSRFLTPMTSVEQSAPRAPGKPASPVKMPLRELTEKALLQLFIPAGALVSGNGDIFYLHGRTGMFLEPAPGETGVTNILKMAREGLRLDLTTALHKASATKKIVYSPGLRVKTNGHFTTVNLTVSPVLSHPDIIEWTGPAVKPETPLFLVVLEDMKHLDQELPQNAAAKGKSISKKKNTAKGAGGFDARIAALKKELHIKEEYLQTTNEELETSNEELKSSNEEMQSVNEELQSTNEELETSKEELQSVNEELTTVNTELQTKVTDLSRANNDINNLLAGTGIGTIFVDHQLRILRFTPAASSIINLIQADVGRPVSHIVSNLIGYDSLIADTQSVLDTLLPKEVQVQTKEKKWFTLHIQPYRTLDNVIEGAVITFTDITEIKLTQEALRKANDLRRLAVVVRDAHDAITVQDMDGGILAWNPGAEKMYGWDEAEALKMNIRDMIPDELREETLSRVHQLSRSEVLEPYHTKRNTKDGRILDVTLTATALTNEKNNIYAIATTEREIKKNQ